MSPTDPGAAGRRGQGPGGDRRRRAADGRDDRGRAPRQAGQPQRSSDVPGARTVRPPTQPPAAQTGRAQTGRTQRTRPASGGAGRPTGGRPAAASAPPAPGRVVRRSAPASVRGRRQRASRRSRANQILRGRTALVMMIALLAIAGVKLVLIQTVDAAAYAAKGEEQRTREVTLYAQRGPITDRNGTVLAFSVEGRALAVRPALFRSDAQRAAVAGVVLGVLQGSDAGHGSHHGGAGEEDEEQQHLRLPGPRADPGAGRRDPRQGQEHSHPGFARPDPGPADRRRSTPW